MEVLLKYSTSSETVDMKNCGWRFGLYPIYTKHGRHWSRNQCPDGLTGWSLPKLYGLANEQKIIVARRVLRLSHQAGKVILKAARSNQAAATGVFATLVVRS